MMAIWPMLLYITSCYSHLALMAGTGISIIKFLQVRMGPLNTIHDVFLKLSSLHFAYILAAESMPQFIEVVVCSNNMSLTCGHLLIKHVCLISDLTRENCVLPFTMASKIGFDLMKLAISTSWERGPYFPHRILVAPVACSSNIKTQWQ